MSQIGLTVWLKKHLCKKERDRDRDRVERGKNTLMNEEGKNTYIDWT